MGNKHCKHRGCNQEKHQSTCIRSIVPCNIVNDSCTDCRGSGYKMKWTKCGYCSSHCDAANRTSVDLHEVQDILKSFQNTMQTATKKLKELEEENERLKNVDRKMDEQEFKQSSQEIESLTKQLDTKHGDYNARKDLYKIAKKIYKQQKSPVFIHKNITQKIKNDQQKYHKANALPFTLTMDQNFSTFDKDTFKREFAAKMDIPIASIKIVSVREGSVICHTEIAAFEKNGIKYTVGAIAEKMTEKEASKRLVEFGVFLAEFGEPINTFKALQQKIYMNPKWNRIYGRGNIDWEGTLNSDKTEPYYCPRGWKKFTCKVTETCEQFDAKYKSWPVAYHGTKFSASMMISFSRLRAGGHPDTNKASGADCFGTGVYFSPSIEYAAHPLYAHPKKMSSNAKEYAGQWVQVVLNCRLKPGRFSVHSGTIGDMREPVDPNYKNTELEWLVHAPQGAYLDESQVIFCGYMIRTSDCDPKELQTSKWWGYVRKQWYES